MQHMFHIATLAMLLFMFAFTGTTTGATLNSRIRKLAEANIVKYLCLEAAMAAAVSVAGACVLEYFLHAGFANAEPFSWVLGGVIPAGIAVGALFSVASEAF